MTSALGSISSSHFLHQTLLGWIVQETDRHEDFCADDYECVFSNLTSVELWRRHWCNHNKTKVIVGWAYVAHGLSSSLCWIVIRFGPAGCPPGHVLGGGGSICRKAIPREKVYGSCHSHPSPKLRGDLGDTPALTSGIIRKIATED